MNMIPRTMKAAVLTENNRPLEMLEIELPESLEYGQVLVKLSYSGICGSQLNEIEGAKGHDPYIPHLLGHEGSGHVVAVGAGVRTVAVDDPVVLHWREGAGVTAPTPAYECKGKKINAGWVTTFNEYAIVSEDRVTTIDSESDLAVASLLGCAVTTGLGTVNNIAQLKIGQSMLVIGAGGVGLSVVEGARIVAGHPIIAADLVDEKLTLAKSFGATHCINSSQKDLVAEVRAIVGDRGVDVVVESTGIPALIETAYELTANDGKTVLVGVPAKGKKATIYTLPLHFKKTITGSHGGLAEPEFDIPRYLELFKLGRLKLEELITDRYAFDDINMALDAMREGKIAGRCLLEF